MEKTVIGAGEIFVVFFVTLGPLKILGPWVQRTRDLDEAAVRKVAVWAFVIAKQRRQANSGRRRMFAIGR